VAPFSSKARESFLRASPLHTFPSHSFFILSSRINYFMKNSILSTFADVTRYKNRLKNFQNSDSPTLMESRALFSKAVARKRSGKPEENFGWDSDNLRALMAQTRIDPLRTRTKPLSLYCVHSVLISSLGVLLPPRGVPNEKFSRRGLVRRVAAGAFAERGYGEARRRRRRPIASGQRFENRLCRKRWRRHPPAPAARIW